MKRNTLIIAMLLLPLLGARAQYVTYNHDETKMNQVTVMETGAGELTPALFYSVVHNKYYRTAAETNKLRYRSEAAAHGAAQVGISETIDTSLTKRAEIEALNMADRQVDLAWQAEGPKIRFSPVWRPSTAISRDSLRPAETAATSPSGGNATSSSRRPSVR